MGGVVGTLSPVGLCSDAEGLYLPGLMSYWRVDVFWSLWGAFTCWSPSDVDGLWLRGLLLLRPLAGRHMLCNVFLAFGHRDPACKT